MALALALVVAILTLISLALFIWHPWWFPVSIAADARAVDHQFTVTFIITGIIFVVAQMGLAYFIWRNRDRGDGRPALHLRGHNKLEAFWTGLAAVIFLGLSFMGYRLWANTHFTGAEPGALKVEVWGEQYAWHFRYPGPDGVFGATRVELISENPDNDLGVDRQHDLAARDDLVTTELAVPVNQPVELILRSKDVTHSFFVRELRLKQDVVPGMEIPVHFTATRVGDYEIACSQLCGTGHFGMRSVLHVVSEADYQKWLAAQTTRH
jgi:cytochrome c oxidase subunit II